MIMPVIFLGSLFLVPIVSFSQNQCVFGQTKKKKSATQYVSIISICRRSFSFFFVDRCVGKRVYFSLKTEMNRLSKTFIDKTKAKPKYTTSLSQQNSPFVKVVV